MVLPLTIAVLLCLHPLWSAAQFPSDTGGCPTFFEGPYPSPDAFMSSHAIKSAIQQASAAVSLGRETQGTPGVSAAVVYDQEIIWNGGFGQADAGNTFPIDGDTIFRIGSISKVFTVLSMMVLRNMGKLDLDDEVQQYVPEFQMKDPFHEDSRGITFRQLSTHLAGLPSNIPFVDGPNVTNKEAFMLLRNMSLVLPTDTMPLYSNLGFAILGNALSQVYGKPYYDMAKELVLGPLYLNSTSPHFEPSFKGRIAEGYLDSTTPCGGTCWEDYGWSDPAGSYFSSAKDLASLISRYLSTSPVSPANKRQEKALGGSTFREMMLTRYMNADKRTGFAMPFELYSIGNYLIKTKRGDVTGFASDIIMVPELKLGIVVLANLVEHAAAIAQSLVNILIPAYESALLSLKPEEPFPPNWKDYVGSYTSSTYGTFKVSYDLGALYFLASEKSGFPGVSVMQWQEGTTQFQLRRTPGDQQSCFTFELNQVLYQWVQFQSDGQSFTIPSVFGFNAPFVKEKAVKTEL